MINREAIIYEPDERSPISVSFGVGFQIVMAVIAPTVIYTSIIAAGMGEKYLTWAVFAALITNGIATALQALRFGRLGGGHMLISGASSVFVGVSVTAIETGGPSMLATLIVVSALFQFALGAWLPSLRRIITPVVYGVVMMLIAASVILIMVGRLQDGAAGAPPVAAPLAAGVTLAVVVGMGLYATGALRFWSPLIAIVAGTAVAASFGLYDPQRLLDAPWFGLPEVAFPGFYLVPSAEFFSLLPMFLVASLASALKVTASSVVMQRVSFREPKVTDFRLVQGTINANGIGSLLAGIAGTLPPFTLDSICASVVTFTGVAARVVGYVMAAILIAVALFPKLAALLLTIPPAVTSAYILTIMGMLLVDGMKTVVQEGMDPRRMMVVGISLSVGLGLQGHNIFADLFGGAWGALLGNGMVIGAIFAIAMTSFMEITGRRASRLEAPLEFGSLPRIDEFLRDFSERLNWKEDSAERMRAVGEEALLSLLQHDEDDESDGPRRLIIVARPVARSVELEFMAVIAEEENIEDRLAYLNSQTEAQEGRELSLRLLRHYASSVRHRKYHGIDIVTVQVENSPLGPVQSGL